MKIKSSYIVGGIIGIGLLIYLFSKRKVTGSVMALESEATITYNRNGKGETLLPDAGQGTVDFGTELQ
jgi:hypothetical protein